MTRINLTDDNGVQTANWFNRDSAEKFDEETYHNGQNWISKATGSQWEHEAVYITPKKRFLLNRWSDFQGSTETYEIISKTDAVEWLIKNEYYEEVEAAYAELLEKYEV